MQLIKYRPHNIEKRDITPIIDINKSNITLSFPYLSFSLNTTEPHRLINNAEVEVSCGDSVDIAPIYVIDSYNFKFSTNITAKINPVEAKPFVDNTTLLVLSEAIEDINTENTEFSIYNKDYEEIYTDCIFAKDKDGNLIRDNIIIPIPFTMGQVMESSIGGLYIINTNLLPDSENISLEDYSFKENEAYFTLGVPIAAQIDSNLNQDDIFTNMISENVVENTISPTLDNEKQIFEPYIKLENDNYVRAQEIAIDIHFRKRDVDNNWSVITGLTGIDNWNKDAQVEGLSDSLSSMGFTASDIRYQKARLKKSFLRLLFYDSNDITNQNLLFYSTIFLDATDYYSEYTKNLVRATKEGVAYDIDMSGESYYRLDSELNVMDRYDYTKSSEGFYLYLYPTNMVKNVPKTIYMKAEFNHAEYGKTISLGMPTDEDGTPYVITDNKFPTTYLTTETDSSIEGGKKYKEDMASYFKDLFVKINVEYNEELGKYVYYFPFIKENKEDRKIRLKLFELRVNGID